MPKRSSEALKGTEPQTAASGPSQSIDLEQVIEVTVVVRSRASDEAIAEALDSISRQVPTERTVLALDEFVDRYGSTAEDLRRVETFAAEHGLRVEEASRGKRSVALAGSLTALESAFGVSFGTYAHPSRSFRSHTGPVRIPGELSGVVEDVIGLDDRPHLRNHAASASAPRLQYVDPRDVADYYSFPRQSAGAGECVAIVEFGGGFYPNPQNPSPDDMGDYFAERGLEVPQLEVVELLGQRNEPATPMQICQAAKSLHITDTDACEAANGSLITPFFNTVESTMDIQLIGTIVPQARLVTYFSPDTPRGHFEVFSTILNDRRDPSVVSVSWGSCENEVPEHVMRSVDKVLSLSMLRGITICASSGDWGDGAPTCGKPSGHFPASSPHVLACGGTDLDLEAKIEYAWKEDLGGRTMSSGFGQSSVFERPWWQAKSGAFGDGDHRVFPDVAGRAELIHGYDVLVGGLDIPMGGTSAAAPMWASLVALVNSELGARCGFLNPFLYTQRSHSATVTVPDEEGQPPPEVWDKNTGLGRPVGSNLLKALRPDPGSE